ncbi:MAG: CheR family methyltransferase [Alphaproteobacteria bacterium]
MRLTDFDVYRDILREKAGILIALDKTSLLDSRLSPVAKRWGYASVELMTLSLKAVPEKQLVEDVVEAMSDHDTCFFQSGAHFNALKNDILPYFLNTLQPFGKIRIWSLGCATGQEAWSLALLLKECAPRLAEGQCEILATDMSRQMLNRAREASYSQYEVQRGLPIRTILKYFTRNGDNWQLNGTIQKMVRFEPFNLLKKMDKFGEFQVIFCHGVLGALDPDVREKTLKNLGLRLAHDGFLFVNDVAVVPEGPGQLTALPGHAGIYVSPDSPAIARIMKIE